MNKAWIAAGSAVVVAIITYVVGPLVMKRLAAEKPQEAHIFSGVVRQLSGYPISGARVQATFDQLVPQSSQTDSDGVFHFEEPPNMHSLHITVFNEGSKVLERDANLHRTGPEVIYLQPETSSAAKSGAAAAIGSRPSAKPLERKPVVLGPAPPRVVPTTIVGSNVIGVNNGTATVTNNFGEAPTPDRAISTFGMAKASQILDRTRGMQLKLRVDGVGDSQEIRTFREQVVELFRSGGWSVSHGFLTYREDDLGTNYSHGEGVQCFGSNLSASNVARYALLEAGIPCVVEYSPQDTGRFPADFFIKIGPRVGSIQ